MVAPYFFKWLGVRGVEKDDRRKLYQIQTSLFVKFYWNTALLLSLEYFLSGPFQKTDSGPVKVKPGLGIREEH